MSTDKQRPQPKQTEQAERARLARKAAAEAEAEAQLAQSFQPDADTQLEMLKRELSAETPLRAFLFFLKETNPQYLKIRGKNTLISSNIPRKDIFALPLDGAHATMERVTFYEGKGWPLVGAVNLEKVDQTEGIKAIRAHIKMVQVYKDIYAANSVSEIKNAPSVGIERKIESKRFDSEEVLMPKAKSGTVKALEIKLKKVEEEADDIDDELVITEIKEEGKADRPSV